MLTYEEWNFVWVLEIIFFFHQKNGPDFWRIYKKHLNIIQMLEH